MPFFRDHYRGVWPLLFGKSRDVDPEVQGALNHFNELVQIPGFGKITAGLKIITSLDLIFIFRGTHNYERDMRQIRVIFNRCEQIMAGDARKIEIGED